MQNIAAADYDKTARRPRGRAVLLALVVALAAAGCSTFGDRAGNGFSSRDRADTAGTAAALAALLAKDAPGAQHAQLFAFYTARDFRPVWSGSEGAVARAASAMAALRHAEQQGLPSADYLVPVPRGGRPLAPGRDAAAFDLALTGSVLRYAHDVRVGRTDPHSVYKDAELPPQTYDAGAALASALDHGGFDAFLADLPPPRPEYRRLVVALARYRALAAQGGWGTFRDGSRAGLVRRLRFEDPVLAGMAKPGEADVKWALMRFQERHGLDAGGRLDGFTCAALNVPASERVKQIAANMERWRWLPRSFEARHIRVDVPDQSVVLVSGGKAVLRSKVVVGRSDNRTPILRTTVEAIVANPPWDIPDDIAAKSLLPHLKRDASYLESRDMVLAGAPPGTAIDWRKVKGDALPYQIQQKPGPDNVLGQLMLDMPNDFDVYLHGTPNGALFALDNRARSHGCVRVERIFELASRTLGGSGEALAAAVASGTTARLPLAEPVPVYMLYWTAVARADGTVAFRPDRYGRDAPLIARLTKRRVPSRAVADAGFSKRI